MAHHQHAQGCQTNPTLRVSQASEFSPTTNPGPLGTRSTAPSSHPPHMPMCLSRPSHLHSHTAVSLSVCQPRLQSVSPVNDKTFGKSISFFLNQSPAQMQVRMPIFQTLRFNRPASAMVSADRAHGLILGKCHTEDSQWNGLTVDMCPLPPQPLSATSSSPQSSSPTSASHGITGHSDHRASWKAILKTKTKQKHCSRLVVLKLFSLKPPLYF